MQISRFIWRRRMKGQWVLLFHKGRYKSVIKRYVDLIDWSVKGNIFGINLSHETMTQRHVGYFRAHKTLKIENIWNISKNLLLKWINILCLLMQPMSNSKSEMKRVTGQTLKVFSWRSSLNPCRYCWKTRIIGGESGKEMCEDSKCRILGMRSFNTDVLV